MKVQVLEDLLNQMGLSQVKFPVRGATDLDAEEVADGTLHGEFEPALLQLCDDVVHVAERRAYKEGIVSIEDIETVAAIEETLIVLRLCEAATFEGIEEVLEPYPAGLFLSVEVS